MAGHSKWSNIKHKKANADAKRDKLFTKILREISCACRLISNDPNSNPRLRLAIDKANHANIPKVNIQRAMQKTSKTAANAMEIRYEGYGPSSIAMIIDCVTDNKNRTVSELRHILGSHGGKLATDGSVAYMFYNVYIMKLSKDHADLESIAMELNIIDIYETQDGDLELICDPSVSSEITEILKQKYIYPIYSEYSMKPNSYSDVYDECLVKIKNLINHLYEIDSVIKIHTNLRFDISD